MSVADILNPNNVLDTNHTLKVLNIAAYCRISSEEDHKSENVSIENQKAIIEAYVKNNFPNSRLTFFVDRDVSGHSFERDGYKTMREALMAHEYDVLIVNDLSRFSRNTIEGSMELDKLREEKIRIISILDNMDLSKANDWMQLLFRLIMNEMPVQDASKKVKNVIKSKQIKGEWLCAVPYGYIVNKNKQVEIVPTEADVVRKIFELYNNKGWGYKKIANHLTGQGIPTPRTSKKIRMEANGEECRLKTKAAWSLVTIQEILDNDFYIGTLRQGKYTREKINGKDIKCSDDDVIVIEDHHQPIIDYRTFSITRSLRDIRTKSDYRGVKKYDNIYTGLIFCGDCGSNMIASNRKGGIPAYICHEYHKSSKLCTTSHRIHIKKLDQLLKIYVSRMMERSSIVLEQIKQELSKEKFDIEETERTANNLAIKLEEAKEELKATKRARIREISKNPEREEAIEEIYAEMESDLEKRIEGYNNQIAHVQDRRNAIIQVNRKAKTVLDVFHDILEKEKLDDKDVKLIFKKIIVFEDHVELKLRADIDAILRCRSSEDTVNFNSGIEDILNCRIVQNANHHKDKVFNANVISDGDPSLNTLGWLENFCISMTNLEKRLIK